MKTSEGPSFDIVIAGGSFVGLTLARALSVSSRGGLSIAVIDQVPLEALKDKGFDGRSSALSAASTRMLKVLGVWDTVSDIAQPIVDVDITDSSLEARERPVFLHFDNALNDGEPASHMVENMALRQAMARVAEDDLNIQFIAPDKVLGFRTHELGVEVDLERWGTIQAKLLVAADGRESDLRKQAGIKTVGWSYEQMGLVATIGHEKPHGGRAIQHFLPSGPFAILPLTDNRSSLVWTEESDVAKRIVALDDAGFLEHVGKRFGDHLGALSLAGPRGAFPLKIQIARAFRAERLVLVGDAAHGIHPLAGQGLNIGLRDVAALTEALVEGVRVGLDVGSEALLARYEQWRRFDVASSAFAMDGINRLFSNDAAPVRAVRDFGLKLVDQAPMLKQFFVQEAGGVTGELPRLLRGELA